MASTAALGVNLHLTLLMPYEAEQFMYRLLGGLLVSWVGYFFFQLVLGFSILSSVFRVLVVSGSLYVGIFVSIGIYRLFFHRLRGFSGPLAAGLTKFYSVSQAAKTVQYHKDVARIHEEYGDFVRTGECHQRRTPEGVKDDSLRTNTILLQLPGPRELCIVRRSAVLIYGPNLKCRKSTWYEQVNTDKTCTSINMIRDGDKYRRRRRSWDRAFAIKGMHVPCFRDTYRESRNPVDEQFVPGNTAVFVPTQLVQTDERYWPRAREFLPERFSSRTNIWMANQYFAVHHTGLHSCPGKNLAWMSMRTTLSKIAQHFGLSFGPGEDGHHFDAEALGCFTMAVAPLMVRFINRSRPSS
ncbi:cytochrome P450 [Apiospora hydei]|uniref:Cytochrome P450 n=1 Tax=Apiospora hydei TaxID=1337664 RepID=A0ABR1XC68_9PEZI